MVSGWLVAIVLAIVLVLQMKNPGEGGKTAAQKQGASKSLSPEKTGNRCPKCGGKGQYNEKYQDQYCWECKDYFEDLK